jgi:hypothetical protein
VYSKKLAAASNKTIQLLVLLLDNNLEEMSTVYTGSPMTEPYASTDLRVPDREPKITMAIVPASSTAKIFETMSLEQMLVSTITVEQGNLS